MIKSTEVKILEDQFVARLRRNLSMSDNLGGIRESDSLPELRKMTSGKLLRSEFEAKYPLGKSLSVRMTPKSRLFSKESQAITLTGRVIVRMERFVEKGSDDEPISQTELSTTLAKESDLANRNRYESILGLYSPTGWAEEAKSFVQNEPPGSGWASHSVYPILIGPEITELVWDKKSDKVSKYIQCFCGLTLEERSRVCKDQIQRAILVQEFANLERIARTNGFDLDFVKRIAKELTSGSKDLAVAKVSGVGWVLKKRI
jgi:hypothetical protein